MMATLGLGRGRWRFGLVTLILCVLALVNAPLSASALKSNLQLHLSANVDPVPNFDSSGVSHVVAGSTSSFPNPCVGVNSAGQPYFIANDRSVACTNYVLRAINRARRLEGVGPMVLPSNWYRLSTQQQIFIVTDLERVDRGLAPYAGTNAALNVIAGRGARAQADPSLPPGFAMRSAASNWAGTNSVLEADYSWMYDDGWAGTAAQTFNYACTGPTSSGCWAHREIMLGQFTGLVCPTCAVGTGFTPAPLSSGLGGSYTLLIVHPPKALPYAFTWAKNVAPFLAPTASSPTTTSPRRVTVTTVAPSNNTGS